MAEPKIGDRRNVRGGKVQWWTGSGWSYKRPVLTAPKFGEELPTSRYAAIEAGRSMFVNEAGNIRLIRNFGSADRPQGRSVDPGTRRNTRGARTRRQAAEAIATPNPAQRRAADRAMAAMAARGNVGHHGIPVASVASGKAGMTPERAAEYDARYAKAGRPVGHTAGALVEMSKSAHDVLHNVDEVAYYKALRAAGKTSEQVFSKLKSVAGSIRFSPLSPINSSSPFSAQGSIEAQTNVTADSPAMQMGFKLAN
jgi:hypothetical protein